MTVKTDPMKLLFLSLYIIYIIYIFHVLIYAFRTGKYENILGPSQTKTVQQKLLRSNDLNAICTGYKMLSLCYVTKPLIGDKSIFIFKISKIRALHRLLVCLGIFAITHGSKGVHFNYDLICSCYCIVSITDQLRAGVLIKHVDKDTREIYFSFHYRKSSCCELGLEIISFSCGWGKLLKL